MEKIIKEIQKTCFYWGKKVLPRIVTSAWETSGMKAITATLLFSLIIMCLSIAAFLINKVSTEWVNMTIEQVQYNITLIGCSCIVALIIFLALMVYVPAKIHEEYGGFMEKPYEMSAEPHPDSVGIIDYVRAIKIKTTTPFDVSECRLQLLEAIDVESGEDILRRPEYLAWSLREGSKQGEPKTIQGGGQSRLCNTAVWHDHKKVEFTLVDGPRQWIPDGKYLLTIQVTGKWQGQNFNEKENFCLSYQTPKILLGPNQNELDELELIKQNE